MSVYGFKDEGVARKLKDIALSSDIETPPSEQRIINSDIPLLPRKLYLGIIVEKVTAASYDKTSKEFTLGMGKAIILKRKKERTDKPELVVSQTTTVTLPDGAQETKTVDFKRTVYNYTTTAIKEEEPTSTGPLKLADKNKLCLLAEDFLGDLYVIKGNGTEMGIAMVIKAIPAGTIDGTGITGEPGNEPDSVKLMEWDSLTLKSADTLLTGINTSLTAIRGTPIDPVFVHGYQKTINGIECFIILSVDPRSRPGFTKGTLGEENDTQIDHHLGGHDDFQLDGSLC